MLYPIFKSIYIQFADSYKFLNHIKHFIFYSLHWPEVLNFIGNFTPSNIFLRKKYFEKWKLQNRRILVVLIFAREFERNWSLEPNVTDLRYFKLWILLDQIIWVWNFKGLQHRVLKILWFKHLSLFQRLNSFVIVINQQILKLEHIYRNDQ